MSNLTDFYEQANSEDPSGQTDLYSSESSYQYTETLSTQEMDGALQGKIKKVRTSAFYNLGLFITSLAMMLMPLIYISLIAGVGYGIYYHAVNHTGIMNIDTSSSRAQGAAIVVYMLPMITGGILILFMIKPFFAKPAKIFHSIELDPNDETTLFLFVEKICKAVHAPVPKQIEITSDVNASASFKPGLFSFIKGDLVLTIGLPLVTGLTTQQFAGVLAHEFGHFSQRFGMRMTNIIGRINHWFARVVYERDNWDENLKNTAANSDFRIAIIIYLVMLAIWIIRKILLVLMYIAHAISCFMSRQMEFNADKHKIRLVGTEAFQSTLLQVQLLSVAHEGVMNDLYHLWQENKLSDDLATLIAEKVDEIPHNMLSDIEDHIQNQRTGLFDTHPSDSSRFKAAEKQDEEGILNLRQPAIQLFENYPKLSKLASIFYYNTMLGIEVEESNLVAKAEIDKRKAELNAENDVLLRYFQNLWTNLYPLKLENGVLDRPKNFKATAQHILDTRKELKKSLPGIQGYHQLMNQAFNDEINARQVIALKDAGFKVDPSIFDLSTSSTDGLRKIIDQAREDQKTAAEYLARFSDLSKLRLKSALQMLYNPKVAEKLGENNPDLKMVFEYFQALSRMGNIFTHVQNLRNEFYEFDILVQNWQGNEENEKLGYKLERVFKSLDKKLTVLFNIVQNDRYPFEHANPKATIALYLFGGAPAHGDHNLAYSQCQTIIQNYYQLYFRLISKVAQIAENVETTVGLKPWEAPKKFNSDSLKVDV